MTVNAIVLKRTNSGESDRRLTLLTAEAGKITVVAKGARKAASRLAGISDPLTAAVMDLAVGKMNSFVTQAQPLSSFRGLRSDFERLSLALSLVELYAAVIPLEQQQPEAFELLERSLRSLESHAKPMVALTWAQVSLMSMEGFMPQLSQCVVTDAPLENGDPFVSPHAGGVVCESAALSYTDRYRVRAEVLFGLERLVELEAPPGNLRFVEETLVSLLPFWRAIADTQLPANEAVIAEVRQSIA